MLEALHSPIQAATQAPAELWAAASLLVGWLCIVAFLFWLASRAKVLAERVDSNDEEPRR